MSSCGLRRVTMIQIPDAPWIRDTEANGVDEMYDWMYGEDSDEEDED